MFCRWAQKKENFVWELKYKSCWVSNRIPSILKAFVSEILFVSAMWRSLVCILYVFVLVLDQHISWCLLIKIIRIGGRIINAPVYMKIWTFCSQIWFGFHFGTKWISGSGGLRMFLCWPCRQPPGLFGILIIPIMQNKSEYRTQRLLFRLSIKCVILCGHEIQIGNSCGIKGYCFSWSFRVVGETM